MDLFGLIGQSLTHSFSKQYFSDKFAREGIDGRYELFELKEIGEFPELLAAHPDLCGLNVTIPYKESIIPFLDELSGAAQRIGAVNTIQLVGGKLIGHNTDVIGFEQSMRANWQGEWPAGALILGSGGASKAVRKGLSALGVPSIITVSRNPSIAGEMAYEELNSLDWELFRIVVNCTPLGTFPDIDARPAIPYRRMGEGHLAFDLVYNPAQTAFMKAAQAQGARVQNGYEMLVGQAEAAWRIWQERS